MNTAMILGFPCDLTDPDSREATHKVLLAIRDGHPDDFAWLQRLLAKISSHPNPLPGDLGECRYANSGATSEEFFASDDPYFEEKRVVYLIESELEPDSRKGVIAHELGHVMLSDQMADRIRSELVDDGEWASEVAADLYALKWGFESELRALSVSRCDQHHRLPVDEIIRYLHFTYRTREG